jgi:predicted amidophosphoribosyltransferase
VYDYDFDVMKIRGPVKELVESNGWKFEQIIFDYRSAAGLDQRLCGQCGTALQAGAAFCTNCGKKVA